MRVWPWRDPQSPPPMATWGDVSAPDPNLGYYSTLTSYQRQVFPHPRHTGYVDVFVNQQGGLRPDGKFIPPPLPQQSDPRLFLMQNARISNPQPVLLNSGSGSPFAGIAGQNAQLGSQNAAVPPQNVPSWLE